MLLLDRVQLLDENHALGLKCLTMNEFVFAGHFPDAHYAGRAAD